MVRPLGGRRLRQSSIAFPELLGRRKTGAFESLAGQNAEPALRLIEPGGVRGREVEMHLGVSLEPTVFLGLVCIQVVQHDMHLTTGVGGYDFIHKIQEFSAATPGGSARS